MATAPKINDVGYEVPANTIAVIPNTAYSVLDPGLVLESLRGHKTREWLPTHSYYCLPLVLGNQYGFIIRALHDFTVIWNGTSAPDAVTVIVTPDANTGHQHIMSHFGDGIVTVQNWFHLRTPPGVNLMTIAPPNLLMPYVMPLQAVIETDNLQRDFTFNFRVSKPHEHLVFRKGDPLGAFIPIPRYFVDGFDLVDGSTVFPETVLASEWRETEALSEERMTVDKAKPHEAGRRYYRGENSQGCPYADHQRRIKSNGC